MHCLYCLSSFCPSSRGPIILVAAVSIDPAIVAYESLFNFVRK